MKKIKQESHNDGEEDEVKKGKERRRVRISRRQKMYPLVKVM